MGILDVFKVNDYKEQIAKLTAENQQLQDKANVVLTAQQMEPVKLQELINAKKSELTSFEQELSNRKNESTAELGKLKNQQESLQSKITDLRQEISELEEQLTSTKDAVSMETFGLYEPRYDFATSLGYKDRLDEVRQSQKNMIKNGGAFRIFRPMTLDNSVAKGKAMQKKNGKQLIRSFNVECEAAINKVTYSNIDRINARIQKSYDQLNKLNEPNGILLTQSYLDSKIDELHLAYEYTTKKQEEKEELREQREREREEKRAQQEIKEAQKQLNKELDHYKKAISELEEKLAKLEGSDRDAVQASIDELQKNVEESEAKKKDLDYRQENATAGYVYIISNIGSFGKDIVKIGVTRRLDPMERIDELGSASVPFKFDVHALIFSYDAYSLETELHSRFADRRINKVNNRKEYYRVPISEIKDALSEYKDLTVDFNEIPEAPEYRESLAMTNS